MGDTKGIQLRFDRYRWYDLKIKAYVAEIRRLRELRSSLPGQTMRDIRVKSSRVEEAYYVKVIETIDQMEEVLATEIENLLELRQDIRCMINSEILNEDEKAVLRLRYLDGKKYREIAREIFQSERSVGRIHARAMEKLEKQDEE